MSRPSNSRKKMVIARHSTGQMKHPRNSGKVIPGARILAIVLACRGGDPYGLRRPWSIGGMHENGHALACWAVRSSRAWRTLDVHKDAVRTRGTGLPRSTTIAHNYLSRDRAPCTRSGTGTDRSLSIISSRASLVCCVMVY